MNTIKRHPVRGQYEAVLDKVAGGLQKHVDSPNVVPVATAVDLSVEVSTLLMGVLAKAAKANSSKVGVGLTLRHA